MYCTFFIALLGIYFVTLWYCIVLHCMIWYLMLSILHTFAFFASSCGLCLARRLFPPSTHPTHLDHLVQPTHPNQSTLLIWIIRLILLNPPIRLVICYLLFVICHLSFGIFYLPFVYLLFVALLFIALLGIYFVTLWYYICLLYTSPSPRD